MAYIKDIEEEEEDYSKHIYNIKTQEFISILLNPKDDTNWKYDWGKFTHTWGLHVPTKERDKIYRLLHDLGFKWCDDSSYIRKDGSVNYYPSSDDVVIYPLKGSWDRTETSIIRGYTVFEIVDYFDTWKIFYFKNRLRNTINRLIESNEDMVH